MTTCAQLLDADDISSGQWGWGVGLSLFACLASVLGLDLQRLSHQREARRPSDQRRRAIKQPLNVIGVALLILSSIVDFFAFGFAPQSLLAPLGAVTLVLNILIAPFFLKEKPGKQDIIATALTFTGVTLAVIFGSTKTKIYTFADLKCLFLRTEFIVYAAFITACLLGVCFLIFKLERDRKNNRSLYPPEFNAEEGEVDTRPRLRRLKDSFKFRAYRAVYPAAAGTVGGGSVLFAKASIELMHSSIAHVGPNPFTTEFMPYVIIVVMVACLVLQGRFLNRGLALYASLFVVPVYQVFWVLVGILGGAVYFDDLRGLSATNAGLYAFGVFISISGIVVLASKKVKRDTVSAASGGIDESVMLDVIDPAGRNTGVSSDNAAEAGLIPAGGRSDSDGDDGLDAAKNRDEASEKKDASPGLGGSSPGRDDARPGAASPHDRLAHTEPRLSSASSASSYSSLRAPPLSAEAGPGFGTRETRATRETSSSRSAPERETGHEARQAMSNALKTQRRNDIRSPSKPKIPARSNAPAGHTLSVGAQPETAETEPARVLRHGSIDEMPHTVPALPTELGGGLLSSSRSSSAQNLHALARRSPDLTSGGAGGTPAPSGQGTPEPRAAPFVSIIPPTPVAASAPALGTTDLVAPAPPAPSASLPGIPTMGS